MAFFARAMALWLSEYIMVGVSQDLSSSVSIVRNHNASLAACVQAMYSASVVDSATVFCCWEYQEIAPLLNLKT